MVGRSQKKKRCRASRQNRRDPHKPGESPALQMQLRGGGVMFVGVWGGQESDTEIALIADRAPERGYEKDEVKDVLPESSSS